MSTDVPSFTSLDLAALPDDPALLKRILAEREQAHRAELQQAVDSAVKQAVKEAVEATTVALLRRFYGRTFTEGNPQVQRRAGDTEESAAQVNASWRWRP